MFRSTSTLEISVKEVLTLDIDFLVSSILAYLSESSSVAVVVLTRLELLRILS